MIDTFPEKLTEIAERGKQAARTYIDELEAVRKQLESFAATVNAEIERVGDSHGIPTPAERDPIDPLPAGIRPGTVPSNFSNGPGNGSIIEDVLSDPIV